MRDPGNELQSMPKPAEIITILIVSPISDDHRFLRETLGHPNWRLHKAHDAKQACRILARTQVPVVLCECKLPDGSWKEVFSYADSLPEPPLFVVVSDTADQTLWAEVLNLGGYDVLAKPFDRGELLQVIGMSWRHWKRRHAPERIAAAGQSATPAASPMAS